MAPFYEVIPPQVTKKEANELREGEKSLYTFMTNLYTDMYNNPEAYHIPVGEYDLFMDGKERASLNNREKKRESTLRNQFQKAIQFYQKLLFEIGRHVKLDTGSRQFSINNSVLSIPITHHNLRILKGEQQTRAEVLSRIGLEMYHSQKKITLSTTPAYPNMLTALSALCKAETKKFALTHFLRCDFRGLLKSHKPSFDDVVSLMSNGFKEMAIEMDTFMRSIPCRLSIEPLKNTTQHSLWKVSYKWKGKFLYAFHADTNNLYAFAYFHHYENISRMGYLLKKKSNQLYSWFNESIPTTICDCKNNKEVDIGGQKKRICGLMNRLEVKNPDVHTMQNLRKILELHRKQLVP